jgi:hypothetical protein
VKKILHLWRYEKSPEGAATVKVTLSGWEKSVSSFASESMMRLLTCLNGESSRVVTGVFPLLLDFLHPEYRRSDDAAQIS